MHVQNARDVKYHATFLKPVVSDKFSYGHTKTLQTVYKNSSCPRKKSNGVLNNTSSQIIKSNPAIKNEIERGHSRYVLHATR
jgi:hypothetical protein